ncbi:Transcription factor [Aphelenchoides avenae]|nr:Transcription factor [Aphelenchus avenae]
MSVPSNKLTVEEIERQFASGPERQALNEAVQKRLRETGWVDQVRRLCEQYLKQRGIDGVSVEEIIANVRQDAYKVVPDEVKADLLKTVERYVNDLTGGILNEED